MAAPKYLDTREAAVAATRTRVGELANKGVTMAGNAFAPVVFVQGAFDSPDNELLAGRVGTALRASLERLGYDPQDWCAISALNDAGEPVSPQLLELTVVSLDPDTIIAIDDLAAGALREAFAQDFASLSDLSQAMFVPGTLTRIRGMRVLNLGNFAQALNDDHEKQVAWARLKMVPKLASPY